MKIRFLIIRDSIIDIINMEYLFNKNIFLNN